MTHEFEQTVGRYLAEQTPEGGRRDRRRHSRSIVLRDLARFANGDRRVRVRVAELAGRLALSDKTIRRVLGELEQRGDVHPIDGRGIGGHHRLLHYAIDPGRGRQLALLDKPETGQVVQKSGQGVHILGGGKVDRSDRNVDTGGRARNVGKLREGVLKGEPIGFAEWLDDHEAITSRKQPRTGTAARVAIARMFAKLIGEGYSLEDLKLATRGAWGNEWRRSNGHVKPENVLRETKVAGLIEDARAPSPRNAKAERDRRRLASLDKLTGTGS